MQLITLPGIKASVWSGGVELKEYNDPHEKEAEEGASSNVTARSYIEAIDGAAFEIKVQALPSHVFDCDSLGFWVYVDGLQVKFQDLLPIRREQIIRGEEKIDANQIKLRKFLFSKIQLTEDQNNAKSPESMDNIGEIKIVFHRCGNYGYAPRLSNTATVENAPAKLSEKQLKGRAISHGTSYGEAEVTNEKVFKEYRVSRYLDAMDKPLAVFKIMYRSRAALQAMLVIPRTPSPPPPSPLRRRAKAREIRSADDETEPNEVKKEKKVKRELEDDAPSGGKKKRRTSSAVIDLTQDIEDDETSPARFKRFKTEDGKQGIDLT